MRNPYRAATDRINAMITGGAKAAMTEKQLIELEIKRWKKSPIRKAMIEGERYYLGEHDIVSRKRTVIGEGGQLREVENLPNNRIVDNQYAKMVDQKTNYLLGRPLTFDTEDARYETALSEVFDRQFQRMLRSVGEDALNGGVAWLYPYYDGDGTFRFKRFAPYEVIPFWRDADHTALDMAVRVYEVQAYEGTQEKTVEKVEVYKPDGVERYTLMDGALVADADAPRAGYVTLESEAGDETAVWGRVPLIPFKYNSKETPLIRKVKSLQDGINAMLSDFANNMQEDARNTILVLTNYDGEDLSEFRRNLAAYGAIKVRSDGGDSKGGVSALQVTVDAENYKAILDLYKKALIENAMGYDAKDDRLSGTPNQMNIQSMYSDIDLDANGMETEFQASFEDLLWFVRAHLANIGKGDFTGAAVNIIFNRDMMMNEAEIIKSCVDSLAILSQETVVEQHPWVSDADDEMERLRKQETAKIEEMLSDPYNQTFTNDTQAP